MIVMSRGTGDAVIIDGNIRISIVDIRGDKVRIGIETPPELTDTVSRREIALTQDEDTEGNS